MISSTVRVPVAVVLLFAGVVVGVLTYRSQQEIAEAADALTSVRVQLDAMRASLNGLALAQRGYFEPLRTGSLNQQFQTVRRTSDALHAQVTELRTTLTNPAALDGLTAIETALSDFAASDARVRTNLANDTYFAAADLVVSAAAGSLRAADAAVGSLQDTLAADANRRVQRLEQRQRLAISALAVVWIVGLLALVPLPPNSALTTTRDVPEPAVIPETMPAMPELAPADATPVSLVDLTAAAKACSAMACASTAANLRDVLADAASAMGARGMIVWLGAGSELFAVLGHGYHQRVLARIGPLARESDNATATAWREATLKTVPAEGARPGAVVAPIVSAQGCIGALSVEVPSGSETDLTVQATSELFAAQLSTIVAAWPSPSTLPSEAASSDPSAVAL